MRVAGLMSGTSLDGLTIAMISMDEIQGTVSQDKLVEVARRAQFRAGRTYQFPPKLGERLRMIAEVDNSIATADIARAGKDLGDFSSKCLFDFLSKQSRRTKIDLVGFHGQTVYHEPRVSKGTVTLQIGDPSKICIQTRSPVVSDFRTMDTAAGGQGAPLVPIADYLRYRDARLSRLVLNIGGISNFTFIPKNCKISEIRAFDVGPGNILIDGAVWNLTRGRKVFDDKGGISSEGKLSQDLFEWILKSDDYRFADYPKSTGRERYSKRFLEALLERAAKLGLSMQDTLATISRYTVFMIAHHISVLEAKEKKMADEIIIGGGGSRNNFLVESIRKAVPSAKISFHDDYGVPSWCWESFSFALIAYLTYHKIAGNVPAATGAMQPVVLGRINYPAEFELS